MLDLLILAQAATPPTISQDVVPWAQVATSLSFAGLAWYLITVQIPKLIERFITSLEATQKFHAEESRYEREGCDRRHLELVSLITSRFDQASEKDDRSYELLREVRHEAANIAHSRAMERAANEAREQQKRANAPKGG